jgi:hypothetical protein
VEGEGMIAWKVLDKFGREVVLQLHAYHMPLASVRLLSPQALFNSIDGCDGHQNAKMYVIKMPDDMILEAPYGKANLPLLQLSNSVDSCLWAKIFAFNVDDKIDWKKAILDASNQNLTAAQRELLVWHFKLSHAGLSTIHNLCRQRRRMNTNTVQEFINLRDGPMLPCTFNGPNAVCNGLLCAACLATKAKRRAPSAKPTLKSPAEEKVLSENKLKPGDRIACDHYISPSPWSIYPFVGI